MKTDLCKYHLRKCAVQNTQKGVELGNSYITSQWLGTCNHWPLQNYSVHLWRKGGG